MQPASRNFPYTLGRHDLEQLLPHRGPLFACRQLQILDPLHYCGVARWEHDNTIIEGHFPGFPLVPGVLLIETATQLAGAGITSNDPDTATTSARIGVLAKVENCSLRHPVRPGEDVRFSIDCRRHGGHAVRVRAVVQIGALAVAHIETLMLFTPRDALAARMAPISPIG